MIWYANTFQEAEVDQEIREWLFSDMAENATCFLCGKELYFPMIMWSGADEQTIYLHEGCATSFTLRLAVDCRELEKARSRGDVGEDGTYKG